MKSLLQILPPPVTGKRGWPWTAETDPRAYVSRSDWPLLTIVTPSYNQGEFIEETIRSVLLQNYPNLEYFVYDGGSTDGSVDILRKYDPWITYWTSESDSGQGNAINKGLRRGAGEILAWLNTDDIYYENALKIMMTDVMCFPEHVAYVASCDKVDTRGRVISTVAPRNLNAADMADWYAKGFFYQPACFFRRSAFERSGGINESLETVMDVDLWIKLASIGSFRKVHGTVAHAKIHEDMKTLKYVPLREAEKVAIAIAHGYRPAALNRLAAYARYHARNQASVRFLVKALMGRMWSKVKGALSRR